MVGNWPATSKNFLVRTCDPSIVPLAAPFNGFCGLKLLTLFASGVVDSKVAVSDLEEGREVAVFSRNASSASTGLRANSEPIAAGEGRVALGTARTGTSG